MEFFLDIQPHISLHTECGQMKIRFKQKRVQRHIKASGHRRVHVDLLSADVHMRFGICLNVGMKVIQFTMRVVVLAICT